VITSFLRTWPFILNHPLASRNLPEAIKLWFKWQVGSRFLTSDCLLAVLLETVDPSIEKTLGESGFQPDNYDPFKRELKTSAHNHLSNNYLWIRNLSKVEDRCKTAPQYQVLGVDF
jgi:hypothetical protein